MNKLPWVHILHALEELVHDIAFVYIFHDIASDDCMKVGLHEVENEVDVFGALGFYYVQQTDDVGVAV